jgi:hypothetical protein
MENTETKVCSKCGLEKPLSEYYFRSDCGSYETICNICRKEKNKIYRNKPENIQKRKERDEKNKDRIREMQKVYRSGNVEKYKNLSKKYCENKAAIMYYGAKRRAKKYGMEFDIELDDIVIPEVCPVLGILIITNSKKMLCDGSPTLDRIDNNKGYVKGNVRVISWRANKLKGEASVDELKKVIAYMESAAAGVSHT